MSDAEVVRRMLGLFSGRRIRLAATVALVAAVTVGTLAIPALAGRAIDSVVGAGRVDFAGLAATLRAVALILVTTAACQWALTALTNRLAFDAARDLRRQAFDHVQDLPISYIDSHEHGDLASRIVTDVDQMTNGLVMAFQQLPTGILTIVVTLAFMFRMNVTIACAVTVLTPFSVFAAKFISSHASRHFAGQTRLRGDLTAVTEEIVNGIGTVEAFGMQDEVCRRFAEVDRDLGRENYKAVFFSSLANPTMRFANSLVYAAIGVFGAFVALGGGISVGGLSAFLGYADQYAKPFNDITGVVTELQNSVACARRLFSLVDEQAQPAEKDGALELVPSQVAGDVRLDHVRFGYSADRPVLLDIDLHAHPGKRIALVGHTGCGKTTLINLLLRFYDVDAGGVSVDGHDVRDIRRLPQGYDTVLDGSSSLSAGQRQLLCIARVMLARPRMLILDEATSNIDTRTEVLVQRAFENLMRGRTSFVVAHRLSTIRNADEICVIDGGRVAERGTHEELLAAGGRYRDIYESQFAPAE